MAERRAVHRMLTMLPTLINAALISVAALFQNHAETGDRKGCSS
jgi:hypothetical protein